MLATAALIGVSSGLGYALPALIGLESMGVPSPGETALVLAAVLASQGHLHIWLVILIGACSAIVGDNAGYLLGRRLGREVLEGPGPFRHRRVLTIAAGDRFFKAHGAKTVFIGRWIALIRFATAWLAGINHMPFPTFFVWNAMGGITWALTVGLLGYFVGHAIVPILTRIGIVAAVVGGVAVVIGLVLIKLRERRAERRIEAELRSGDGAGGPAGPPAEDDS